MGKGSRVRGSRQVARRAASAPQAGAAFGVGTPSRAVTVLARGLESRRLSNWTFEHYLGIAPPSFVGTAPRGRPASARQIGVATTA